MSYTRTSSNYRPQFTPGTDPFSLESLRKQTGVIRSEPPLPSSHSYPFQGRGHNDMSDKQVPGRHLEDVDSKSPLSPHSAFSSSDRQTSPATSFPSAPNIASAATMANIARYGGIASPTSGEWDYTGTFKFKACFLAQFTVVCVFALDQLIITTAVPQIITEFQSTSKLAYLNSAFFIPCAGFVCLFSQFLMIWRPKYVFLVSILIFEAGCGICGGARDMNMLIAGRAIAGLGGAGMWSLTYIVTGQMIPLVKRPTFFAVFGLAYIFASVLGPLVGGALTDTGPSGWRWCFYINLPIGGVASFLLLWSLPIGELLPPFDGIQRENRSTLIRILRIDWIGAILTMSAVTSFAIGLQFGGVTKAWSDPTVIILLVIAPVSAAFLAVWSIFMGARAQLPVLLLKSRHIWAGLFVAFFGYGAIVNFLYYVPLLLEAVHGKSAVGAGVILIAFQIPMCFSTAVCGKLAERTGGMWIPMTAGSGLSVVAAGIFLLVKESTSPSVLAAFLVFLGLAMGCYINLMTVALQADYAGRPDLIPHATAVQNWFGFIGRIVSITIATSIFENKLNQGLARIDGVTTMVAAAVAASPDSVLDGTSAVLVLYANCIRNVWAVNLGLACGCFVACLLLKRINLKDHGRKAEEVIGMQSYQGSGNSLGGNQKV